VDLPEPPFSLPTTMICATFRPFHQPPVPDGPHRYKAEDAQAASRQSKRAHPAARPLSLAVERPQKPRPAYLFLNFDTRPPVSISLAV
jgi:hypothetical protein